MGLLRYDRHQSLVHVNSKWTVTTHSKIPFKEGAFPL